MANKANNLTRREEMALRILSVMFKLIAPDQKHAFKNDEAINFILGESK